MEDAPAMGVGHRVADGDKAGQELPERKAALPGVAARSVRFDGKQFRGDIGLEVPSSVGARA